MGYSTAWNLDKLTCTISMQGAKPCTLFIQGTLINGVWQGLFPLSILMQATFLIPAHFQFKQLLFSVHNFDASNFCHPCTFSMQATFVLCGNFQCKQLFSSLHIFHAGNFSLLWTISMHNFDASNFYMNCNMSAHNLLFYAHQKEINIFVIYILLFYLNIFIV